MQNERVKIIGKEIGLGVLAFVIPFTILILIFASAGFVPFKEDGLSMLMLDMRDQYVAYMRYYQTALLSGNSVIYTLGKFFGGDFMSIFMYYLASPFNLLIVFVPTSGIPAFFFWTALVKMGLAGLNMYLMCRLYFKKADPLLFIPVIGYALISYNAAYMCNFMYLDVIMMIPLVILGIHYLKHGRHYWLYPLTLFYCLMTSWYLGAISCIFFALFFIACWSGMKGNISERIPFLIRFGVFSLLGGFLAGGFWITAFSHLDGTKASSLLPQFGWMSISTFFDGLLENHYAGMSDLAQNRGFMTAFTGVVTLSLAQLFFTNRNYRWYEKTSYGGLFLIYFIVVLNTRWNAMFHGGREPTWYATRYSFLIGFLICFLSGKQIAEKDGTPLYGFILPALTPAIVLPIVCFVENDSIKGNNLYNISTPSLLLYYGALLLFGLIVLLKRLKGIKPVLYQTASIVSPILLVGFAAVSSFRGYSHIVKKNVEGNVYQEASLYTQDELLTDVVNKALTFDGAKTSRMEMTFNRPGATNQINNNPLFYGYNGLNHYSSNEKREVSVYAQKLGFHYNGFYECYFGGSTEAINSFLGMKYLIDDNRHSTNDPRFFLSSSSGFEKMDETSPVDGYSYYKNNYALPLGFAFDACGEIVSQGKKVEGHSTTYWYDHFEYQNQMFKTLVKNIVDEHGVQKDIFKKIEFTAKKFGPGVEHEQHEFGWDFVTCGTGKMVNYEFVVPAEAYDQNLYVCEKSNNDDFRYSLDSKTMSVASYWNKGIKGFADTANHKHSLVITSYKTCNHSELRPEIYYEDSDVLKEYLTEIAKQGLYDTKINSTMVTYGFSGKFQLSKEKQNFLFTLPYEQDFSIKVDGQERPLLKRFDIFCGVDLSGLSLGEHTISIEYKDKGLLKGVVASVVSLVAFVPVLVFYPKLEHFVVEKVHNRKKGKHND